MISRRRRLAFAGTILLVLLVSQEVACRWLFPLPECADFNRMNYTPVEFFGKDLLEARTPGISNAKLRMQSEPDGFVFDQSLNLYGFRGPDFSLDPPDDRSRVLFIGDSFTEGAGASDDETIPEHFKRASRQPVDAINLGVSGMGMRDYTIITRDSLPLLQPKAMFLIVCFNDLPTQPLPQYDKVYDPPRSFRRLNPWVPRGLAAISRWRQGKVVPSRNPSGPFDYHSAVPSKSNPLSTMASPPNIDHQLLDAMKRGTLNPWIGVMATGHQKAMSWDFSKGNGVQEHIQLIHSHCVNQGCRLIVVFIPHQAGTNTAYMPAQVKLGADYGPVTTLLGPEFRGVQRHLREVTQSLGVPFLDTTDAMIEAEKSGSGMFWPYDGHCTGAGYRLVAEICAVYWEAHRP